MARTLGDRIKNARTRAQLSQPQLGRAVGKSTASVYRWEKDETEPSVTTLKRVAVVLKVPVSELIEGQCA